MAWPFKTKSAEKKSGSGGYFMSLPYFGLAGMSASPEAFAREGYIENAVVASCVRLIASACASVDLQIARGKDGKVIDSHPMLDLMTNPNPMLSDHEYIEAAVSHFLIFGDTYVTRLPGQGLGASRSSQPRELWLLQPQHISVVAPVSYGLPIEYRYLTPEKAQTFQVNQLNGYCDLLHVKNFNPITLQRGMSPMQPASRAIDTHNAAQKWNKALLDNAGRPSGAITTPTNADGSPSHMDDEQFIRLRTMVDEMFSGPSNAGRPFILEGGLEWKEMSLSPKEMDFLSAVWASAMHICMAYGVPPQMLGIPGSQTRANFEQADLTF